MKNMSFTISSPESFSELKKAYNLVYREYRAAGYMPSNNSRMRYGVHQLFGALSTTYVARCGSKVVGTGSAVIGSPAGLPSSNVFPEQFAALEQQGRRVVEGTLLACRCDQEFQSHEVSREVMRYGISWSYANGADDFVVVVNPKHVSFWHKLLGFEVLSDARSCPHVEQAPGYLVRLDLTGLRDGRVMPTRALKRFILDRLLTGNDLDCWFELKERHVFELLNATPSILIHITEEQYSLLRQLHPKAVAASEKLLAAATMDMIDRHQLLADLDIAE